MRVRILQVSSKGPPGSGGIKLKQGWVCGAAKQVMNSLRATLAFRANVGDVFIDDMLIRSQANRKARS